MCAETARVLDAHFRGDPQRPGAPSIVSFHGGNGIGDELNGFLVSLTAALATRRRLEVAPQETSYLSVGFTSPFDLRYTGGNEVLRLVPHAIRTFLDFTAGCRGDISSGGSSGSGSGGGSGGGKQQQQQQ